MSMTQSAEKTHYAWVDMMRAIGIFAIVFGHTVTAGGLSHYFASFHVPLFFFISGFVFTTKGKNYVSFLAKKAKSLLIPYVVFALLGILVYALLGTFVKDALADHRTVGSLKDQLIEFCLGYCDTNAPLWFLPCLFVANLLAYPVSKFLDSMEKARSKALLLIPILCLSILWNALNYHIFDFYHLPYKFETVLTLLFFFFLGYGLREFAVIERLSRLHGVIKFPLTAVLLVLGGILAMENGKVNCLGAYSGDLFLFYPSAVSTILGLALLCSGVNSCPPLQYVGRHTTAIMVMHKFPVVLFQAVLPQVDRLLAQMPVLTGAVITLISIGLCLVAELLIDRLCPILLGKSRQKA